MSETQENDAIQEEVTYQTISEFLESNPPNQLVNISDLATWASPSGYNSYINVMITPDIQIHCSNESCNGIRFFNGLGAIGQISETNYQKWKNLI